MTWQNSAITITTLLPIVGALGVLLVPKGDDRLVKGIGIAVTGACLALAIAIAATYDYSATCAAPPCLQFVLNAAWIPVIGARYHVGIDGISMPLYVLTFLLGFLCAIYTGRYVPEPGRIKAFVALTLLLITGMAGTFVVFGAIALGFAVKVPMWPFHTWLPDAHTEAPTIGSVLLAGVMLKMGTYGFVRIALPVLPQGAVAYAPWIGGLAAIAIVYAALACLAQKDLKRLIAFSSVGHMGFVMLGIATLTTIGIQAAIFGMVAHGVVTGMLFFCVGSIYDRYHTREIAEIGGGMSELMPKMAGIFAFVAIASLGLPGLAGFIGEFMALLSSFSPAAVLNVGLYRTFMVVGGIGTILTAGYFLWMLQRVNQGEAPVKWRDHHFRDILAVEWVSWVPLLALTLVLGLVPNIILNPTLHGADAIVRIVTG